MVFSVAEHARMIPILKTIPYDQMMKKCKEMLKEIIMNKENKANS